MTMTLIGVLAGDRAHQRTLAGVAVAARAEHDDELALRIRPQRLQRLRQRIGLVRVIDEDRRAVALADPFQPALGAFEMFEACEHRLRLAAGRDRETCRHQRILDLEAADQRQPHRDLLAAMFERELLRKAVDAGFDQANALACSVAAARRPSTAASRACAPRRSPAPSNHDRRRSRPRRRAERDRGTAAAWH